MCQCNQSLTADTLSAVLQAHPYTGISSWAISSSMPSSLRKMATKTAQLARYNKKPTVASGKIQTALRLILPGKLAKHTVSEGSKAVTESTSAVSCPRLSSAKINRSYCNTTTKLKKVPPHAYPMRLVQETQLLLQQCQDSIRRQVAFASYVLHRSS